MFSLLSQAATRTFFSTVEVRVGLSSGCKDEQEVLVRRFISIMDYSS